MGNGSRTKEGRDQITGRKIFSEDREISRRRRKETSGERAKGGKKERRGRKAGGEAGETRTIRKNKRAKCGGRKNGAVGGKGR